jgi:hypothetical protein
MEPKGEQGQFSTPIPSKTGSKLHAGSHTKGPALGALLKQLETVWTANGFEMTHAQLVEAARQLIQARPDHE